MAHFTTFYSYKGGVGRTLALANVAWLLANHPFEPARVLVVDFDLGAPGLHRVFGMKNGRTASGVVDYVMHFLEKAEVPELKKFIHKTAYSNIDILPSGKMDRHYQSRLEGISWKALYESAHGYQLIEGLKRAISSVQPEYDYVLIDSLTGYSDIGGICVRQLPDSLILLFRLNLQNLDGIKTVYSALKKPSSDGKNVLILPVITPSWPFIDETAGKWIAKAQAVFPENKLLEISFDSGLSFGERIISKSASKLPLTSKVLADYRILASRIREQNATDPLTIWESIQQGRQSVLIDEQAESYLRLLKRRPRTLIYWQNLFRAFQDPRRTQKPGSPLSSALQKIIQFTSEECSKNNKFALLGRAIITPAIVSDPEEKQTREDLDKAIRLDPNFFEAKIQRGYLALRQMRYRDAIKDFRECLELPIRQHKNFRQRLEAEIAAAYLKSFDPEHALKHVEAAIALKTPEGDLTLLRGKAFYLMGDYPNALADVKRYSESEMWHETAALLPSQILAAMGHLEEASQELRTFIKRNSKLQSIANLAEAYLAVDPAKTISLVGKKPSDIGDSVRRLLISLARMFRGDNISEIRQEFALGPHPDVDPVWDPFEVVAMIRAKERANALSSEAIDLAYEIVQKSTASAQIPRTTLG